jgi:methane monooxygenase component A beta chain/propane monooxygenase small subunit
MTGVVPKPPRDFTYIPPRARRLSEYEAVTCYTQPDPDAFDRQGWYLRTPQGRTAWQRESTRLVHPHWFDFRDPASLWQRPYVRMQGEQERGIDRATEDAASAGALRAMDPIWLAEVIGEHYRVWSFVEYGLFRAFAAAQREALADTIGNVLCFEGVDRIRHAHAIVIYLMDLEDAVPGFRDEGAKLRWTNEAGYQPTRALVERLMLATTDWAELAVITNLILDPILAEVGLSRLVRGFGPFHGDSVTPLIVSTVERDRRRNLAWTEEFVRMVTGQNSRGSEVPAAEDNRAVIQQWLDSWTPVVLDATRALAPVYDRPPNRVVSFDDALTAALAQQEQTVSALGLVPTLRPESA